MVCVLRLQWNDVLGGLLVLFTQFLQRSRKESKVSGKSADSGLVWQTCTCIYVRHCFYCCHVVARYYIVVVYSNITLSAWCQCYIWRGYTSVYIQMSFI